MGADRLRTYHEKRDFGRTPEPASDAAPRVGSFVVPQGRTFVVQKHAARRLHYDVRLEWGGVLLSWAVTRGPSADPTAKRLAVRTEDHPVDYGGFEGTIPAGQYGGGTVMLWDRGTWAPLADFQAGLQEGKLKFALRGERMRGAWTLVRMKSKGRETRENWLLIKERDAAVEDEPEGLVERFASSVASGRSMEEIAAGKAAKKKLKPRKVAVPAFRPLQLAQLEREAPEAAGWLHEVKFDGYRCLAAKGGEDVRLYTRSGLDWTDTFGALVADVAALPCREALIDGEVIAPDGTFSELRRRLSEGGPLKFMAFDLLRLDGRDLASLPLRERKARLEALIGEGLGALSLSAHVEGSGGEVLARLCAQGQEGIVSKRADAPYRVGRGGGWRKVKCVKRQEFVIGGVSASRAAGRAFASLLMGSVEAGRLVYRGRVGTGFSERDMDEIAARIPRLRRETSPFAAVPAEGRRGAVWLEPVMVAEVRFAELTADGHIRHGVFVGLRGDKPAAEVRLEEPEAETGGVRIAGIKVSNPDRAVYAEPKVTKRGVAEHYAAFAPRMLPFAGGRPVSLLRCPQGTGAACFFQKHRGEGFPKAIGGIAVGEGKEDYITVSSASGLVAAAQMGTLEFHIWGAKNRDLEHPDRLVFDLDPDEGLGFQAVRAAAVEVGERLKTLGLPSLPMLTGGKGVHVVVPLRPKAGWETVKLFARTFAAMLGTQAPERYTAVMAKSERKGRIFVDWLRNERGATAVAPYSLRARPGAGVAVPLGWEELGEVAGAAAFDIGSVRARLELPCPLAGATRRAVTLGPAVIGRLERSL